MSNPFGVSAEDLMNLASPDFSQTLDLMKQYKGVKGLARAIRTSTTKGLDASNEDDLEARRAIFGTNELPDPPSKGFFSLLFEALTDPTLVILLISAIISLVLGIALPEKGHETTAWIEGAAILISVIVVSHVGAGNNYIQELQFKKLDKQKEIKQIEVIRNGEQVEIISTEIVVGDIVVLESGQKIPADGIFIRTNGSDEIKVDNSSMTGENDAITVNHKRPTLFSGTIVESGNCLMLVIATGVNSQWGQLFARLNQRGEDTPLQIKLSNLAEYIGFGGMGAAIIIFVVLFLFWLVNEITGDITVTSCFTLISGAKPYIICSESSVGEFFMWGEVREIIQFAIVAITVVVVAVPEGLPLAVTLSLAFSMQKMRDDNCLVRRLASCETMGGATNICSDKTGTLTENRMTVVKGWCEGKLFEKVSALKDTISDSTKKLLCDGIAINSSAIVRDLKAVGAASSAPVKKQKSLLHRIRQKIPFIKKREMLGVTLPGFSGNKTECALLVFCGKLGVDYAPIREAAKDPKIRMKTYEFSSARKSMSTIIRVTDEEDVPEYRIYTKGAAEMVLKRCDSVIDKKGKITELDFDSREKLMTMIDDLASQGLRTLAMTYRNIEDEEEWKQEGEENGPDRELTLVAIVGIEDPVREGVPEAVEKCKVAGITVRMVTGDNLNTAKKIAMDCGIYDPNVGKAMTGAEFRELTDDQISDLLPDLQVLARSIPLDKEKLVRSLRDRGEVVGVTGDGTNDVAALKAADVGLSMGIAGTDVAIQASDIVILDDNFTSIVVAIMWGRCVYDNIRKFLQFQLTINISALTLVLVGALSNRGTPLTAVQLLWVNLLMDTLAALALATEKPTPELLFRKPEGTTEKLPISAVMVRNIVGQGLWQLAILLFLLFEGAHILDLEDQSTLHYTLIFNTFVWLQVFNEFNARKVHKEYNVFRHLYNNYVFMAVLLITSVGQVLIVEFGSAAFKVTGQTWWLWFIAIALGTTSLPIGVILRFIPIVIIWKYVKQVIDVVVEFWKENIWDKRGWRPWKKNKKRKTAVFRGNLGTFEPSDDDDDVDPYEDSDEGEEGGVKLKQLKPAEGTKKKASEGEGTKKKSSSSGAKGKGKEHVEEESEAPTADIDSSEEEESSSESSS